MNQRQEGVQIHPQLHKSEAEDKPPQAQRKKPEPKEPKRPDRPQPMREDGVQRLQLDESVRKHNVRLRRIQTEMENHTLTQFRKGRRQMAVERDKRCDEMMRSQQEEYMRQNQEEVSQRKLLNLCEAEGWAEQVKDKQLLKHKQRLEKLKDVEICQDLIRQEEELRHQAVREEVESKKRKLKSQLEEIRTRRRNRERHMETVKLEEEKAKVEQLQHAERALQIKRQQSELFRERQIPTQIVSEQLAKSKEERASATALREEQVFLRAVAQREAEYAEQQKKKDEEEEAARLQALSDYSCCMRQKEEQKQEELQIAAGELQVKFEADRLAVEEDRLKAQKTRENNMRWQDFNRSTAAQRRLLRKQLREEELEFEVKKEEAVVLKETRLQQQAQQQLKQAEERLRRKRRQDVQPDTDGVPERPTPCPPGSAFASTRIRQRRDFMTQPQDAKLLLRGIKLEIKRPPETNRIVLQDNRVTQNHVSTAPCLPPIQLAKKAALNYI